jgi:hypothetical protein
MAPEERARLLDALEQFGIRLEARQNPFVEDLSDGDPEAPLLDLMRSVGARVAACNALAAGRWDAHDASLAVVAAPDCLGLGSTACERVWTSESFAPSGPIARARFLAWPLTAAAVLTFSDETEARRARDVLRANATRSKRIGVALLEADLAGDAQGATDIVALRERARAVMAQMPAALRANPKVAMISALASPADGRLVPRVRLAQTNVLVLPRPAVLADLDAFTEEVAAALASNEIRAQWRYRPPKLD